MEPMQIRQTMAKIKKLMLSGGTVVDMSEYTWSADGGNIHCHNDRVVIRNNMVFAKTADACCQSADNPCDDAADCKQPAVDEPACKCNVMVGHDPDCPWMAWKQSQQ